MFDPQNHDRFYKIIIYQICDIKPQKKVSRMHYKLFRSSFATRENVSVRTKSREQRAADFVLTHAIYSAVCAILVIFFFRLADHIKSKGQM